MRLLLELGLTFIKVIIGLFHLDLESLYAVLMLASLAIRYYDFFI